MRRLSAALLLSTLILAFFVQAQDAKLAVSLGPNPAAWQVGHYQGGKLDAVTVDADGRPAAAIGPNGLVVTTTAPVARDVEITARRRTERRRANPARRTTPPVAASRTGTVSVRRPMTSAPTAQRPHTERSNHP